MGGDGPDVCGIYIGEPTVMGPSVIGPGVVGPGDQTGRPYISIGGRY